MSTLTEKIEIKINGKLYEDYNFLNIKLTQELLKPNNLSFTMQKKDFFKDEEDVGFSKPKELVGEKVSCLIQTKRFDHFAELNSEELEFEGIIFEVNVSRSEFVSEFLIDVVAFSPDYLLMDNKNCLSTLDKSLSDIVNDVIKPYDFPKLIDPKFTDNIPYTVMYNETDYDFLVRLAHRYGEWLYNDGKKFVFGKIDKSETLTLYARTDILDYKYNANIRHDNIKQRNYNYLKPEYFVKSRDEIPGMSGSDDKFLEYTGELRKKSKSLYTKQTLQTLQSGTAEENEADELVTAMKAQLLGEKAELTTCSGTTVRADVRIGSCLKVKDMYDKEDNKAAFYDRDELLVCKITHYAGVNGFYQNKFTAVSSKSDFPPYHDSDTYPISGNQQAVVYDNKDPEKMGRIQVQFQWQKDASSEANKHSP